MAFNFMILIQKMGTQPTGSEPSTGETNKPAIKDMPQRQYQQQSVLRLVGRLKQFAGRCDGCLYHYLDCLVSVQAENQ